MMQNIQQRAFEFSKSILYFLKECPQNGITKPLINQLVRSSTSIGANLMEADESSSAKDFINKINIAKKEAKETNYWLDLFCEVLPQQQSMIKELAKESRELNLILAAIARKTRIRISK